MRLLACGAASLAGCVLLAVASNGPSPLVQAAKSGDAAAVRALLQQGASATASDPDGATALHWIAYHDDLATAKVLLKAGANVNAANDLGATPLWVASENGSTSMVRLLLDAGANPNLALLAGETPLMVASRGGYPQVVELLLAKGADPNARGARGQTALMWAAAQKHPEVTKVLLAHGADFNIRSSVYNEVMAVPPHGYLPYNRAIPHGSDTALLFAARDGDLESARLLVAAGANVNDADAWGVSALTYAAHSGFDDLVEFLLDKGADPNAAAAGFAALHCAILRRDEKMAAALLNHGADANLTLKTWTPTRRSSRDWNFPPELVGASPFWLAARFNAPGIMRLLAQHGADPKFIHHASRTIEGRNGQGWQERRDNLTAIMAAVGIGGGGNPWVPIPRAEREAMQLETVKYAVDLGIDVNYQNLDGRRALDAARGSVAQFLKEKGAIPGNPNAQEPRRVEN